jgi:hypothetical protein
MTAPQQCTCRWYYKHGVLCRLEKWINIYLYGRPDSLRELAPRTIAFLQAVCRKP